MNTSYMSNFANRLVRFLEQKRALGYSQNYAVQDFKAFDRMCAEQFPSENQLTKEVCDAWATRRGAETPKSTNRRLPFIREFARFLIRTGEQAYILPNGTIKSGQRYIPHIYSHREIAELWCHFDAIRPTKDYPTAHMVMPALMRLLYCSGMRPSEALNLRVEDVDLRIGKLFIAESKGHKDRIVMLADDVLGFLCRYDERIREYVPNRLFFFAKSTAHAYGYSWLSWMFRKTREDIQFENLGINPPRLYDLRHTFATHRLYRWMQDGKDLYAMLPYLCAYMGHQNLTETAYYLHLAPGVFETISGFKYESMAEIFPEVVDADE